MARLTTQNGEDAAAKASKIPRILVGCGIAIVVLLALFVLVFWWVVRSLPHTALVEIGRITNTQISAKSVRSELNGSVFIEQLVVRPERPPLYDDAILKAKSVYARFDPASVLLLRPTLREIRISDFVMDAQFDLDAGGWNISAFKLNIRERGPKEMPAVRFERGTVQYSKVSNGQPVVAMAVPIDATFALGEDTYEGYSFEVRTAGVSGGSGTSSLRGFWKPGRVTVAGGISSTDIPSLERAWTIDAFAGQLTYDENRNYELILQLRDFHNRVTTAESFTLAKPVFLDESNLFTAVQRLIGRYRPAGTVDIDAAASGNFDRISESKMTGKINCKDLSICDIRFPYRVENLAGQVDFSESHFAIVRLAGKHGDVNVVIDGWSRGFGTEHRYLYRITSDNMALDDDLYSALRPDQKQLWSAFSPRGTVGVDYRFGRSSPQDKQETLAVELRGANATYRNFAYPMENLKGEIFFDHDMIVISDVVSQKGDCKITLNGKVTGWTGKRPIHYVTINGNNVPLDSTLAAALQDKHRQLYSQVDPNGFADIQAWVFTPDANAGGSSFHADVTVKQASLKLGKPPIVVSDVSAQSIVTPESVEIRSSMGRYGQGTVSVTGGMRLTDDAKGEQYRWKVQATQIPLSVSLVGWLPESFERIVSAFRAEGNVDLDLDLHRAESNSTPDCKIAVNCLGVSANHERFPYPLKNITGRLMIAKDGIAIEHVSATLPGNDAEPNATRTFSIAGQAVLADGAFAGGAFEVEAADVLLSDELGAALPKNLGACYGSLSPSGRFDLQPTTVRISRGGEGDARRTRVDVKGTTCLKTCGFNAAGTRPELSGVSEIEGSYDEASGLASARVGLTGASVTINGKAVTGLEAGIIYDPERKKWRAENFTGYCYGGKVFGDLEVSFDPAWPASGAAQGGAESVPVALDYLLQVGLDRVDLQQFLLAGRPKEAVEKGVTTGTMNAALGLSGQAAGGSSRIGLCRVNIINMQVGKVSPLAKLLSVLRLTEPRDYTFEQMLVDSYISRDRLLIRQFDMSGASLALNGSGWMDLRSENVNLTLTARGQRLAAAEPSVLQSLTEGLGGAVIRMEVTGNFSNPEVQTKALPVIEDSLRILGTPK